MPRMSSRVQSTPRAVSPCISRTGAVLAPSHRMLSVRVRPDVLYAWQGSSLLIVNTHGESGDTVPLGGFYYREARFLRALRLEIDGNRPWLCESSAADRDRLEFV